eukprot:Plantae.Rhodophyta-Hildenbrandia_rubra.ctg3851.p1 GENE.Plantae.Rhodophyta-Hildenbrandia_rubra.ctg3851~~Plantae.Rhodophyta-Hildenbrandia_rubra.ctg3851.p1  ORF type:complete len:339 (+),score=46.36 Plantae.Rhodophyta-Hildenbrandia_rubra.ctg3851:484-1500(+)
MAVSANDGDSFLSEFRASTVSLERDLNACTTRSAVDAVSSKLSILNETLSAHSHMLAPYDSLSASNTLNRLEKLSRARSEVLNPKPKFSFRAKRSKERVGEQEVIRNGKNSMQRNVDSQLLADEKQLGDVEYSTDKKDSSILEKGNDNDNKNVENQIEIHDKADMQFVYSGEQIRGKDVVLSNLSRCKIYLLGTMAAILGDKLSKCQVITGPVDGSVLLSNCNACIIHGIARQFRIHTSISCKFFLRATSGPIIEDCNTLMFAPYVLTYSTLQGDLESIGISDADTEDQWRDVKDFKWLRKDQPSPNWCLAPSEEQPDPSVFKSIEEIDGALNLALPQ